MNLFLAKHFCKGNPTNIIEINELLFSTRKATYDNKADLIVELVNRHYGGKEKANTLEKSLKKIGIKRNMLAHFEVEFSDKAIKSFEKTETIYFLQYKNSVNPISFTPKEAKQLGEEINKTTGDIMFLTKQK